MDKKLKLETRIEIDGLEFIMDIANMTGREIGKVKRIAGLKGWAEIPPALEAADLETMAVIAGIAMERAGKAANYDELLDMPLGKIKTFLIEPEEADNPFGENSEDQTTQGNSGTQA